ncbi:hypothetical protein ASE14_05395 [Agromyces sp. Root81]|uniref:nucleotidyltransferase family protein n=1 Tax=Agromyces sp. Root81 TaxID=1736601 RepID=UPI0006F3B527|nr:nucleotidyltransferase family protein [Agromyces sp. Root81]KRC60457.1 hypothetical protein ASE14_05395 [Agromyces sp. Root81]
MENTLNDIAGLRVRAESSVRDCIAAIGENRRKIALVVDADDILLGIVTDGDIRRGILRGLSIDASVTEIMNDRPTVASPDEDAESVLSKFDVPGIDHVPVVGPDGRVLDLITRGGLHAAKPVSTPVVLMAGGRGQRLYPLTKDVPKPMLPIGEMPLLEIILRRLAAQGFVNVYISVNYLADVIIDHVGDGRQFGLKVEYLHEDKPLGTAGALAALAGAFHEPFLVMNSDLLTHVDLRELLSFHKANSAAGTIGVREHVIEIPYGVVNLDGVKVASMAEKPLHRSLVNAGIYALEPLVLDRLSPGEYADMPTLLGMLMAEGRDVTAFPIHESWLDIGRPEDLIRARTDSDKWMTQ